MIYDPYDLCEINFVSLGPYVLGTKGQSKITTKNYGFCTTTWYAESSVLAVSGVLALGTSAHTPSAMRAYTLRVSASTSFKALAFFALTASLRPSMLFLVGGDLECGGG